jgi:hypothetical protein
LYLECARPHRLQAGRISTPFTMRHHNTSNSRSSCSNDASPGARQQLQTITSQDLFVVSSCMSVIASHPALQRCFTDSSISYVSLPAPSHPSSRAERTEHNCTATSTQRAGALDLGVNGEDQKHQAYLRRLRLAETYLWVIIIRSLRQRGVCGQLEREHDPASTSAWKVTGYMD